MKIGEFRLILDHLQALYLSAGAKGPAKDVKSFSDVLKPHAEETVVAFCANAKNRLSRASEKPKGRKKTSALNERAPLNDDAIKRHVAQLRNASTDRQAFDAAFDTLKADTSLKSSDVAEIARQYSDSVTRYKSIGAAHTDISRAYVRQARFANKLR